MSTGKVLQTYIPNFYTSLGPSKGWYMERSLVSSWVRPQLYVFCSFGILMWAVLARREAESKTLGRLWDPSPQVPPPQNPQSPSPPLPVYLLRRPYSLLTSPTLPAPFRDGSGGLHTLNVFSSHPHPSSGP